jgi:alpha/beta superfamily hydrolase
MPDQMEKEIRIPCGHGCLEGVYKKAVGVNCALVAHPHPLMGGAMDNNIVRTVADSLGESGFSTLRFNFRGVGNSTGSFDSGRGEQDDVLAALAFLETNLHNGPLVAGYSFGAWVCSHAAEKMEDCRLLLIAPPLDMFDFDPYILEGKVELIIAAEHDQFCTVGNVGLLAQQIGCALSIIPGADHFFGGCEKTLKTVVIERFR